MAEFIVFNNKNSYKDFKIKLLNEVIIPFPNKRMNPISIDGADGDLYEDLGGYDDIVIPVNLDILDEKIIKNRYRSIKRWLNQIEDNKLMFSTDLGYFYKVKKVEVPNNYKTVFNGLGEANINFICDPYTYDIDGVHEISLPPTLCNYGDVSKPIYRIKGEGMLNLYVNDNLIKLNIGQEIIIDTDLELIYREGSIENNRKTGKWEDLYLKPGENKFNWNGNFSITVIPNWRCL